MLVLEEIYRTKKSEFSTAFNLACSAVSAGGKNPFYFMMIWICSL